MKKYFFSAGLIVALSVFALGSVVFADNFGLDETAGAAKLNTYGSSVPTIAGNIIGTLLSMISVLFFVLVLYGGILWMTARGNSEQTEKAMSTIIAAVIGIIIIMGAYALTNFVFKLGGSNQTTPLPLTCTPACISPKTCQSGECKQPLNITPFKCGTKQNYCTNKTTDCEVDDYCVDISGACTPIKNSSPCNSICSANVAGECTEAQHEECEADPKCAGFLP